MLLNNFLIADLEATGVIPTSASILTGSFLYCDKELNVIDSYDFKSRPRVWNVEANEAVAIHGISFKDAMEFPDFNETMLDLAYWLETLQPSHFVAHVNRLAGMFDSEPARPKAALTSYDYELLTVSLLDIGRHYELYRVAPIKSLISTHSLAKFLKLPCEYNLKAIAQYLGLAAFAHHEAKADTKACYEIAKMLLTKVDLEEFLLWENYKLKKEDHVPSTDPTCNEPRAGRRISPASKRPTKSAREVRNNTKAVTEEFNFDL